MSTGVRCSVFVNGSRLADGQPTDPDNEPVALSGLSITWGRDTTVDQPPASTCSFQVMDAPGGQGFINVLRTGYTVDVTAEAVFNLPPDQDSTFRDPGFELNSGPRIVTGGTAVISTREPHTGVRSLEVAPAGTGAVQVVLAPAPFVPEGTNPGAWDGIDQAEAGTPWTFRLAVRLPPFTNAVLRPVLFSGPYQSAYTVFDEPVTSLAGSWSWEELTGMFSPTVSDRWVGVQVTINPTGARWLDMPDSWANTPGTWEDYGLSFIDDVDAFPTGGETVRRVLVFSGRITDLSASWDEGTDASVIQVTATDFTADLDNIRVGDEPWPVEPMATRFQRILELSNYPVTATLADSFSDTLMSYQDVDSQAVTALLKDLAQSVDGVLWSATHQVSGSYLVLEDPAQRVALYTLELVNGQVEIVVVADAVTDAQDISACDILRDPVAWTQTVADVATRVSVTWLEQGTDEDGQVTTTERTHTLVDEDLELEFGRRAISVSTMLQANTDATAVATRMLARTSFSGWRASGLTIDDDESLELPTPEAVTDAAELLLLLLDGTRRLGLPIRLTDLPTWTPVGSIVPVYLEGGTYAFTEGTWELALNVSGADSLSKSLAWNEVNPDWAWDEFNPAITWNDLYGVGAAAPETT